MSNFLDLYDQYFGDVYRYIYFKTGNKWDADDLVSETFRKAFEKYRSLRGNPKAWLMTIARNTMADFYRKRKGLVQENTELDRHAYAYSFEEVLGREDEMICLQRALRILSEDELELINLKYFSELTHRQIGEVLNKSTAAVKMKSMRIMRQVRESVKRCMEGK